MTFAMDQWFWWSTSVFNSTMSPTVKCLKWSKEFLPPSTPKFISNVLNSSPFPSTVRIWCSERSKEVASQLLTSLSTNLKVKWHLHLYHVQLFQFTIASTYIIKVFMASSFKLDLWVLSYDPNTACPCWHYLAFPHYINVMWLQAGGFFFQIIQSLPRFCKNLLILFWSISRKPLLSSLSDPMKLHPLSDLSILLFPWHPINLLKLMIKESVPIEFTTSRCMAQLVRHVKMVP